MTKPDDQRVAENVRAALARRQITGSAAAKALGMHERSFSRRAAGQVSFRVAELISLAEFLKVNLEALTGRDAA